MLNYHCDHRKFDSVNRALRLWPGQGRRSVEFDLTAFLKSRTGYAFMLHNDGVRK